MKSKTPNTVASLIAELLQLPQDDKVAYAYITYKGKKKRVGE